MFDKNYGLYIAHGDNGPISLNPKMANRHGLIAGATGTGKTVTLQVIAETLSQAGVPCFMADIKGDLSGIAHKGNLSKFIEKRCAEFGLDTPKFSSCPVRFFDVFGEQGHPMRATISGMGADLMARLLELNPTQTGILNIVFRIASDENLLLIDLKDLRSMLDYVAKNSAQYTTTYGNISSQSIGAIQRALLALEAQGADKFFGEPNFNIQDLIATEGGMGVLSVLAADKLVQSPKVYSTFLMWLLNEIYTTLPEVGDLDYPKLVFFFDEAHLLFDNAPKALLDNIERVVRLIRSKGVGIYFVTQNPIDVPDSILGQLGNRVQHALRAFTPRDQKAVKAAAQTFRANSAFDTEKTLQQLGTGEALVSFLDEKGAPSIVENAKIMFPLSHIGAISVNDRNDIIKSSLLYGKYDSAIDRESAFEIILAKKQREAKVAEEKKQEENKSKSKTSASSTTKKRKKSGFWAAVASIAMPILTSMGRSIGREVVKSVTGSSSTTRRRKK
ncbi:MAG: DUF853 domain-containing protein [Bacteroides sp.]|nr:DUF853 domain-containing protein [Bacteroides sp.]MCM1389458.1 DUF853 domain-containing protein [Bacteroides sp.]